MRKKYWIVGIIAILILVKLSFAYEIKCPQDKPYLVYTETTAKSVITKCDSRYINCPPNNTETKVLIPHCCSEPLYNESICVSPKEEDIILTEIANLDLIKNLIILTLAIPILLFIGFMFIDSIKMKKWKWFVIILFFGVFGALLYFFQIYKNRKEKK
jgi:hypothetical protein